MNIITILGPTASGKTRIAALLASKIGGEIIGADSRQVYKDMNIGTGKDYEDYIVENENIPFHLIDIKEAGDEYNVYEYQNDFIRVFKEIGDRTKIPILCGGSGLYIEAVLKGYKLINVPINAELRAELEAHELPELVEILSKMKVLHNMTDKVNKKRAVRAIEIELYYQQNQNINENYPVLYPMIFGINYKREITKKRITERLEKRLDVGLIDEVSQLLEKGITHEKLLYYGLEYKYISKYLTSELDYKAMFERLNIAIHQFAKRQMTWFRRMERNGFQIHWIDGDLDEKVKLEMILSVLKGGEYCRLGVVGYEL